MTTYRIWHPTKDRYVVINETLDDLYDVRVTTTDRFVIQGTNGLVQGEFERVCAAVRKFQKETTGMVRPEGLVYKVTV